MDTASNVYDFDQLRFLSLAMHLYIHYTQSVYMVRMQLVVCLPYTLQNKSYKLDPCFCPRYCPIR